MKPFSNYIKSTAGINQRLTSINHTKASQLNENKSTLNDIINCATKDSALDIVHFLMGKKSLLQIPKEITAKLANIEGFSNLLHNNYINPKIAIILKDDVFKTNRYFNQESPEKAYAKLQNFQKYDLTTRVDNLESSLFQETYKLKQSNEADALSPPELPNRGNDCFVNSAIQFILNNESLRESAITHPNQNVRHSFQYFILNPNGEQHRNLVSCLRKFAGIGRFEQDSAPMLLQKLFIHKSSIMYPSAMNEDQLNENKYNVFYNLDHSKSTEDLFAVVNNFPQFKVEDSDLFRCIAFDDLKTFVINNNNLVDFFSLFHDKNYTEFKELIKDQNNLALLSNLIKHNIFQQHAKAYFSWTDTSGYGFRYNERGIATREEYLDYNKIPEHKTINAMIVHYGNVGGGHYVSYIKKKNQWYLCNDARVTAMDEDKLNQSMRNGAVVSFSRAEISSNPDDELAYLKGRTAFPRGRTTPRLNRIKELEARLKIKVQNLST
jgi:hypothetical protein